jgi:asparagine synthase (glutamine-hydrolysing)
VWHEDEPIAHPSSVPLYFVSALARQHVTVVLTGEGSDELLAGYGKYPRVAWNWRAGTVYERMLPAAARVDRRGMCRCCRRVARYARRSFLAMDRTPEAMFFDNFASIRLADQQQLLAPAFARRHADRRLRLVARLLRRAERQQHAARSAALRGHQDLPRRAADEAGPDEHGALDREPRAVPRSQAGGVRGDAARRLEAVGLDDQADPARVDEGLLPESILNRPKMGFPVPFARWTRGAWNGVARDVLLDRRSRERGVIDPAAVDRCCAITPRAHRGWRPHLEPAEPRALVSARSSTATACRRSRTVVDRASACP